MFAEMRRLTFIPAAAIAAALAVCLAWAGSPAAAQDRNQFETAIRVNDRAITRFEIAQRALMLTALQTVNDPVKLAREELIEDRIKEDAAERRGLSLRAGAVDRGMDEYAARANMSRGEFLVALAGAGVHETTFRDFVRVGIVWRELIRALFSNRIDITEEDLDRARQALSGASGIRVLLSEIVLPTQPDRIGETRQFAERLISQIDSFEEFSQAAQRYSASESKQNGGRLPWLGIAQLAPSLQPAVLGMATGDISEPLKLANSIIIIQMRDIEEVEASGRQYAAIDYSVYRIPDGASGAARQRAASIVNRADSCDDLFGIVRERPSSDERLDALSRTPREIPEAVTNELALLDPGEFSDSLIDPQTGELMLIMMCGRTPLTQEGQTIPDAQLSQQISNRRLNQMASRYLEQLRAEARIVELD